MELSVHKLEGAEFRKKSGTSAKERAQVEAAVIEHVERYLTIEEILELDSAEWHRPLQEARLESFEQAADLADRVRRVWNLGEDPIPNMTELLEERGIKICITPLPESVSGMTCLVKRTGDLPPVPVIVVNRHHTLERRRLTLAHELAHRLIHETSPIDHEKAAYFFAGAFLIPQAHLVREIGKHRNALGYYELVQLKLMYRVRAAALLVRLKDIGVIDASTLTYAFQTFAKSWRREEPAPLEALGQEGTHEPTRRFERLCYWALAEQLISLSKASELLQRPLRRVEMDMKGPTGEDAHYCQ